ncbi:hypothetical protein D3C76_429790 [compost metagenome]
MLFKWEIGRQQSGYDKMPIISSNRINFDLWLLRFKPGSYIAPHVDTVPNRRHYRLNIFIKPAKAGGEFRAGNVIYQNRFLAYFRPDISTHSVSKVESGTRYVLSFGFTLKGK